MSRALLVSGMCVIVSAVSLTSGDTAGRVFAALLWMGATCAERMAASRGQGV